MNRKESLQLAVSAGELLLKSGAEIARAQDTILRILESFQIFDHHIFVITNGIFVSIDERTETPTCAVRYVTSRKLNLARIIQVNALARDIVAKQGDCDTAYYAGAFEACATSPGNPFLLELLACATGCGCFCYLLGGSILDSIAAFLAGSVLQCFLSLSGHKHMNPYIRHILAGALVTLICALLVWVGIGSVLDRIIIGVIMPLVPGVALTTAIRDLLNSDYLSGIIHLSNVVLVAASIAVGVGTMLYVWSLVTGVAL